MRRAFTLLEMLVVCMIIAILAGILFPVYGHAKTQAKRAVEASQLRQLGMAAEMYLSDYDDVYFPRKIIGDGGVGVTGAQAINPDYQAAIQHLGQTQADTLFGIKTRNVEFYSQLLAPYIKSQDVWLSPANPNAWVGADPFGTTEDPAFGSYGGQNSIGVNLNLFSVDTPSGATGGIAQGQIDHPSELMLMTSADYYVVASRDGIEMPVNQPGSASPVAFDPCREPFFDYWKNIGNSRWALLNKNTLTFDPVPDSQALESSNARFNGFVLMMYADSHVRSMSWHDAKLAISAVPGNGDPFASKVRTWDPADDVSTATACTSALPDNDPTGVNR